MFAAVAAAALAGSAGMSLGRGGQAAEPLRVVVSLPPVHSLAAQVMEGAGAPRLLLRGGGSPHTYALKPSDARALGRADVVFWVGPAMERFLVKPLAAAAARDVALLDAPGVRLAGGDPHIWLGPANAKAMVRRIADMLAGLDAANASRYRANAKAALARLDRLSAEISGLLAGVRTVPYVTFHDAYGAFETAFGLRPATAVVPSPEQRPGARRLRAIRATIRETGAACVFTEPQFRPALVQTIVQGTGARIGVLDPLGHDLKPGPDAYGALMRGLARSLAACLGG